MNPVGADVRRRAARFTLSLRLVTSAPTNLAGSGEASASSRLMRRESLNPTDKVGRRLRLSRADTFR